MSTEMKRMPKWASVLGKTLSVVAVAGGTTVPLGSVAAGNCVVCGGQFGCRQVGNGYTSCVFYNGTCTNSGSYCS